METSIMGFMGYILGLYWDNGKENGTYCLGRAALAPPSSGGV